MESYIGNSNADLFEITEVNARGELRDFLLETRREEGREQQLHDLTVRYANGSRVFDYESQPDLRPADEETRAAIVEAMGAELVHETKRDAITEKALTDDMYWTRFDLQTLRLDTPKGRLACCVSAVDFSNVKLCAKL